MMKICSKCGVEKDDSEFNKNSSTKDGLWYWCKECRQKYDKEYYRTPQRIEYNKKYNSDPGVIKRKREYEKTSIVKKRKAQYNSRPEVAKHRKEYHKKYEKNPKRIKYKKNQRSKVENRILNSIRRRTTCAITEQGTRKHTNTMSLIGCSRQKFKKHLELQFTNEMSWDNYGSLWHIDHCIPCSHFDLKSIEQQKECFHYTNMKPMLAVLNMRKNNKFAEPRIFNTI